MQRDQGEREQLADNLVDDHLRRIATIDNLFRGPGAADADQVPQIIGSHDRPLVPHGRCSVMVAH